MRTVGEIAGWLEEFAPSRLAESWDNVGLLWGDPGAPAERVMTCLTVTGCTASEAVSERAELIVSHHPVLFRGAKRIRSDLPATAPLWLLARAGIAVASPHTAFDNTTGGINDVLGHRLGLQQMRPLRAFASPVGFKIVVFTPESDHSAVLAAAFAAGAGRIGDYTECSFATAGHGTFFGSQDTNPAVGQKGQRETVAELRLEVICPAVRLVPVVAAIRSAHSYEEPAIDVYPLQESGIKSGAGRLGHILEPRPLDDFALFVSQALGHVAVQTVGDPCRMIERVAIACGAGDDFLEDAIKAEADVLLTGEARFHRALEAESHGLALVLPGHYGTERIGVDDLAERIARAFPDLTVWPSQREKDPLRLVHAAQPPRPVR
jgi:dinuclear metal center YbgI/SA1388 family protein